MTDLIRGLCPRTPSAPASHSPPSVSPHRSAVALCGDTDEEPPDRRSTGTRAVARSGAGREPVVTDLIRGLRPRTPSAPGPHSPPSVSPHRSPVALCGDTDEEPP